MNEKKNYDDIFVENIKDILENGTKYTSRAVWEEGDTTIPAKCIKLFGLVNRYNTNGENIPPIGRIRKFAIKNCIDEILWIWQKKSNNIHDLRSHIWDSWADENGSIGGAYGFQVGSKLRKATHTIEHDGYKTQHTSYLDQTDFVIHELKYNPMSRRILTDLYSVDQTAIMGLDPCCYSCTWNVTYKDGKPYLNLLLNQRSQDMVVANNWNVFQYWILQNMFAHVSNMEVGELVHVIADAHIYDRHIPIAEHMINDLYPLTKDFEIPSVEINHKDSFYNYTIDDFKLVNYQYAENITNIPVAV